MMEAPASKRARGDGMTVAPEDSATAPEDVIDEDGVA